MILMGCITFGFILTLTPKWTLKIENKLIAEEKNNMYTRTLNFASLTENQFAQTINDMDLANEYAEKIFNNELVIENYYPNFYGVNAEVPEGGLINGLSDNYSAWYNHFNDDEDTNIYLNNASLFDDVFRLTSRSNPAYLWLYSGYEDGLYRGYPFDNLNGFVTYEYTCLANMEETVGYDPRCRGWYINAKNNQHETIFSEPYNDASTGGVIITLSRSIHNASDDFIGVLGFDLSMTTSGFEEQILDGTIINDGYTYIFDESGNLIFSPMLTSRDRVYTILEIEFNKQSERDAFEPILDVMTSGESGQDVFTKYGDKWYINYEPISGTTYGIAMIAPEYDIKEPSDNMIENIDNTYNVSVILVIVFTAFSAITGTYLTKNRADIVVQPLNEFNHITTNVTQGNLDEELGNQEYGSSELQMIGNRFNMLIQGMRFSNEQFFNNDIKKAYDNYKKMEKIFIELNNKRGLGVVWNNMAEALSNMKDVENYLDKALEYFNKAIQNAEEQIQELNDKESIKNDIDTAKSFYYSILAKRYSNLSLFYFEKYHETGNMDDLETALTTNDSAINTHELAEDILGRMITLGNRGLIYMELNNATKAEEMFVKSYDVLTRKYNKSKTDKIAVALQYASMNLGMHYFKVNMYEEARKFLNYALILTPKINKNVKNNCLLTLIEIYETYYGEEGVKIAEQQKKELNLCNNKPKHVHFILDTSYSMEEDEKIYKCRQSIIDVISNHLNDHDLISLTIFDDTSRNVFARLIKSEYFQVMEQKIQNETELAGRTLFYDSVGNAIEQVIENDEDIDSQWIVTLTDGSDNRSNKYMDNRNHVSSSLINMIRDNNINIIIMTVGNLNNLSDIQKMSGASNKGLHISIENPNDISQAFQQAAMVITMGHKNIESF